MIIFTTYLRFLISIQFLLPKFFILADNFEELSPLTLCSDENRVATEAQCVLAATALGYAYASSGDWRDSWDFAGCQRVGNNVYFNTAYDLVTDIDYMRSNYVAICIAGTDVGMPTEPLTLLFKWSI